MYALFIVFHKDVERCYKLGKTCGIVVYVFPCSHLSVHVNTKL